MDHGSPGVVSSRLNKFVIEGKKFAQALESVSEAFLAEHVEYPEGMEPRVKSRFETLIAPKEHEMHHRGQLMVIERMLGIAPHGRWTSGLRRCEAPQTGR